LTTTLAGQVIEGASLSFTVTVNEQVAVLPEPSVATNAFAVTPVGKLLPLDKPVVWLSVDPVQLSLKLTEYVTIAAHWPGSVLTLTFAGQVIEGASLSLTVTVNEQVAVLPDPSVTTNVFAVTPLGKLLPLASPAVWLSVAPAQLSLKFTEYVTIAAHWPGPLLTTTFAGHAIEGASVSFTVTVNEHVAVLPEPSVTRKAFEVTPLGKLLPLASPAVWLSVAAAQLSLKFTEYVTFAEHWPGSLLTLTLTGHVMLGASVSFTFTVNEQVAVFPEPSVTMKVFAVTPLGKLLPLASPAVWLSVAPAQLSLKLTE
jgi:hypothetical protein